ncbi:MAG: neutral zinc metallopeptidase [Candidatus Kapaibacteriales bacterium]
MNWRGRRGSSNIRDVRGSSGRRRSSGLGGLGGLPIPIGGKKGGFSIVTLLIIVGVMWLFGINPLQLLTGGGSAGIQNQQSYDQSGATMSDTLYNMVSVVLADTEEVWGQVFKEQLGKNYQEPSMSIFSGSVNSGCGYASSQMGPFYCPLNQEIYIDLGFYTDLHRDFGAPGDFAMAYVVAHEVGHHVQKLTGVLDRVQEMKGRMSKEDANALQVKVELQADYYAGLWAHYASRYDDLLDETDLQEALRAAGAIGDDMIQKRSQGYVVPESFTHGTSEQRRRWLLKGYKSGLVRDGDTFSAVNL